MVSNNCICCNTERGRFVWLISSTIQFHKEKIENKFPDKVIIDEMEKLTGLDFEDEFKDPRFQFDNWFCHDCIKKFEAMMKKYEE